MHHGLCESSSNRAKSLELIEPGLNERLNVATTGALRPTLVALLAGVKAITWNGRGGRYGRAAGGEVGQLGVAAAVGIVPARSYGPLHAPTQIAC